MFEKVKEILMEELQLKEDEITLDADLKNDLGINSLELADLVMICEEKFDVEMDDEMLGKILTVGDIVDYLSTLEG
ncbi:MAG: acyl carrier protein [Clostridia bacterium]|nr:acyl carrier protein [Clostridia bacterium]